MEIWLLMNLAMLHIHGVLTCAVLVILMRDYCYLTTTTLWNRIVAVSTAIPFFRGNLAFSETLILVSGPPLSLLVSVKPGGMPFRGRTFPDYTLAVVGLVLMSGLFLAPLSASCCLVPFSSSAYSTLFLNIFLASVFGILTLLTIFVTTALSQQLFNVWFALYLAVKACVVRCGTNWLWASLLTLWSDKVFLFCCVVPEIVVLNTALSRRSSIIFKPCKRHSRRLITRI